MQASLPQGWNRPKGYANGVAVTGRHIVVSSMIGWDANELFQTDDFAGQARLALENVAAELNVDGAKPTHASRMTWYATGKREYLSPCLPSAPIFARSSAAMTSQ